jgi:hypothetical protein
MLVAAARMILALFVIALTFIALVPYVLTLIAIVVLCLTERCDEIIRKRSTARELLTWP